MKEKSEIEQTPVNPTPDEDQGKKVQKQAVDWFLWGTFAIVALSYFYSLFFQSPSVYVKEFTVTIFTLMNQMSWGLFIGVLIVGVLDKIPQEAIQKLMGRGGTFGGIIRATFAGILLDMCSHGILMVGMKLYQRGLSLGQTMAFLIASPWNSLSLTLVLWGLVGFKWMIIFLILSMIIAIISGFIFDVLVKKKVLPQNPNKKAIPANYSAKKDLKNTFTARNWKPSNWGNIIWKGLTGSRVIFKWIFFGVIAAALMRTFITPEQIQAVFGPTLAGLGLTLFAAVVLEVCSEGSAPIAAEIMNSGRAPGNSFAFLMSGVASDYTEVMAVKDTTKSWKIALFLPLITFPQVVALAIILNQGFI